MYYDAHLHAGMYPDVEAAVRCALNSSVTPVLVGIHLQESENTLKALENSSINVPVFVGIHPWYLKEHSFDEILFEKLLSSPLVLGIGECGLDNKIDVPLDTQIELLSLHLDEAVAVTTARWLSSEDPKALKEISDKVPQSIALDGGDNLTFLATSGVNLNLNMERYPKVKFSSTREH